MGNKNEKSRLLTNLTTIFHIKNKTEKELNTKIGINNISLAASGKHNIDIAHLDDTFLFIFTNVITAPFRCINRNGDRRNASKCINRSRS